MKALVAAAHVIPDVNENSNQDHIIFDIHHFFAMILSQVLNTPGLHNMQIITDIRLELNYVYRLEKEKCGVTARCVKAIRDTLCRLLEKALDIMQDKITSLQLLGRTKSSIFSSGKTKKLDKMKDLITNFLFLIFSIIRLSAGNLARIRSAESSNFFQSVKFK